MAFQIKIDEFKYIYKFTSKLHVCAFNYFLNKLFGLLNVKRITMFSAHQA